MMLTMTIITLMTTMVSPLKIAFMLIMMAMSTSLISYYQSSSVFPPSAIIISFASGMMILFCYCSMTTSYEKKSELNKMKMTMFLTMSMMMLMVTSTENNSNTSNFINKMLLSLSSPFMITSILVVMMTMMAINKTMFSPKKSMMLTY